jgi:hypothetical protein
MLRNEDKDSYFEIVDGDKTINIICEEKINETAKDDINVTTKKNRNVNVQENDAITVEGKQTIDVTGSAKYTSADTDIESGQPVGINGSATMLGADVLQPYWSDESSAWAARAFLPSVVTLAEELNLLKSEIMAADAKAKASGAKSIK